MIPNAMEAIRVKPANHFQASQGARVGQVSLREAATPSGVHGSSWLLSLEGAAEWVEPYRRHWELFLYSLDSYSKNMSAKEKKRAAKT